MNEEEILNMPAGREIDALVGEAIANEPEIFWAICNKEGNAFYDVRDNKSVAEKQLSESPWLLNRGAKILPIKKYKQYSADISAAFEVIGRIIERFGCDVSVENRADIHAQSRVYICKFQYGKLEYDTPELMLRVIAETAPLAICRAALLALEQK